MSLTNMIWQCIFFFVLLLPQLYVNSRYAKPRFKKLGFEILDTGNMYLIRTPAGLRLQWFHSTGMMVIETESYNNKLLTMGLCGTWCIQLMWFMGTLASV